MDTHPGRVSTGTTAYGLVPPSSNGKTSGSAPGNEGSTPSGGANSLFWVAPFGSVIVVLLTEQHPAPPEGDYDRGLADLEAARIFIEECEVGR